MTDRSEHRGGSAAQSTSGRNRVLASFPAGHPRGSKPAEESARQFTANGTPATYVMDLRTDEFLVVRWAA